VILAGALALSALREDDAPAVAPGLLAAEDPGPVHVHGLGVNPADGSLFIATHTGMYRMGEADRAPERVTDRLQDTMGFTIVGPNRFLGSGHPDLREAREKGLPPLLGLIESVDAGQTWTPVSLLGQADFHVLRSLGPQIYGFDATGGRLMFSRDAGRNWVERRSPGALLDLAVNPARPSRLVAAGEAGISRSEDGGRTWKQLRADLGFLAWPAATRLFLVREDGTVLVSSTEGRSWRVTGEIGGQPAALLARSSNELYVALHDGTIKRSADGGASFAIRSTPGRSG